MHIVKVQKTYIYAVFVVNLVSSVVWVGQTDVGVLCFFFVFFFSFFAVSVSP